MFIAHTEQLLVHQFKKIKVVVKKPTHKAIHIGKSHQPKLAKEYVFANADRRTKKKYDCPTLAIRNAGESADMKVITLNKLTVKRKSKCFEIAYFSYTKRCTQAVKTHSN